MPKQIIKGGDRLWNLRWDKVEKDHPEFKGKAAVFSYATKIVHPKTISFISGAIPVDKDGFLVGKGNMFEQIAKVLDNLKIQVELTGATLVDVMKLTIFTTDVPEFLRFRTWLCEKYPELFGKAPGDQTATAITLLGVTRLANPDAMVEIEAYVATNG
jgi:enamine deaminase RidA (YjgF/YER057c/UK114 family)